MRELDDPNLPAARLRELATSPCELTRRGVARHPNTPEDVLTALLDDPDHWVSWNLAQNPAAKPDLLETLARLRRFPEKVAANRNAPDQVLIQLAAAPEARVRGAVALNPAAPAAALAQLASDAEADVRRNVARNPASPPEVLAGMAQDPAEPVRRAVARNRSAPQPTKLALKQALGM